jgi:hypothetical protein
MIRRILRADVRAGAQIVAAFAVVAVARARLGMSLLRLARRLNRGVR